MWASKALANPRLSPLRQPQKQQAAKPWNTAWKRVEVHVRGPGSGRETALRSLQAIGLEISGIKDVTPLPHNGCRPPQEKEGLRWHAT